MNHFNLPLALPFRFVKLNGLGIHFDDQLPFDQIRDHQRKVFYPQKWIKSVKTKLQCESSIAPNKLQLRKITGEIVKEFEWSSVVVATSYRIYETEYDVTDVPEGMYFLYQVVEGGDISWKRFSNAIEIRSTHKHCLTFKYKNSFNKDDIAWSTGLVMNFICEADIQSYEPDSDRVEYNNQTRDSVLIDAVPGRAFKLYVGDTIYNKSGVAPYIVDILDRIFCFDFVSIAGTDLQSWLQYKNKGGSDFKISEVREYPLIGAQLEVVPSKNLMSTQDADSTPFASGIITAYNIETGFFSSAATVPVINVEENE